MLCISKNRNLSTNFYLSDERMAKKPNDRLVTVIQNSPKTAIREHSNCQKFEDKGSQKKNISVLSWKAHARPNSIKIKLEDRSQKKKIMFLHSKNKASRKGYKGEC